MKSSPKIKHYSIMLNKVQEEFNISYNRYLIQLGKCEIKKSNSCKGYLRRLNKLLRRMYAIKIRIEYYSIDER